MIDLHIHSKYSFDSLLSPKTILKVAKKKGLTGIAVTDHNTIRGGLEVKEINKDRDFTVIVGSEVQTEIGDIIGLYLSDEIKSRISIEGRIDLYAYRFDGVQSFSRRTGRKP